jgi:hypothetical protein
MASYSKYSRQPGDSILALLEPGEYVLNRNAVNEIGKENLDELNFEDAPRFNMAERMGMQMGGMLGEVYGMQAGGDTLTYGGATTETKSLEDVYKSLGIQPKFEQREKYENKFAYDPSREGVLFEDYGRDIQSATDAGRSELEKATSAGSQYQAKSGFMGTGAGPDAVGGARDSIMSDFLQKEAAAKSTLFKDVRSERENWFTEATRGLGQLESEGGTVSYRDISSYDDDEEEDRDDDGPRDDYFY